MPYTGEDFDVLVPRSWLGEYVRQEDLTNLQAVKTTGDQTINGIKAFTSPIWLKSNTIRTNNQYDLTIPDETSTLATRAWVDNEITNGGFLTTDSVQELENKL